MHNRDSWIAQPNEGLCALLPCLDPRSETRPPTGPGPAGSGAQLSCQVLDKQTFFHQISLVFPDLVGRDH